MQKVFRREKLVLGLSPSNNVHHKQCENQRYLTVLTIHENDVKQTKILDEKVMCTCMKGWNKYANKMGEESVKKSSFLNTHGTNWRCMDNRIHLLCQN